MTLLLLMATIAVQRYGYISKLQNIFNKQLRFSGYPFIACINRSFNLEFFDKRSMPSVSVVKDEEFHEVLLQFVVRVVRCFVYGSGLYGEVYTLHHAICFWSARLGETVVDVVSAGLVELALLLSLGF